jgi:CheY-like chemotaxis protein
MAPKYRILVVDDQQDIRNILRVGVESLGPEFSVVTVPSGEEAILEITMQKFDLLVADVRLPGISGLEVLRRMRASHPNLKIILVTGVLDPVIRRNVADSGADAFFLKPIEVADFLDAVERCLGIVDDKMPESSLLQPTDIPEDSVSERLAKLRKDLDAFSAILFDERGRVVVQAGELPDDQVAVNSLYPALMAGFRAGMKVSHFLGASRPESLTYFGGTKFALFFAPVSTSHALLVAVNAVQMDEQISHAVRFVYTALYDLQNILEHIGVSVRAEEPVSVPDDIEMLVEDQADIEEDLEEAPILDAIFESVAIDQDKPEDLDAFWDSAAEGVSEDLSNADVLTYEQALQLGLTPDEDVE